MTLDQARLDEFIQRFCVDLGAAMHAATVVLGDRLGLYKALADTGPADPAQLAEATSCDRRLVEEWLKAQYVSGYCRFSPTTGAYWLTPEQAAVLADPASPVLMVGSVMLAAATIKDEEKVRAAFLTGQGLGWHEHHHDLFHGTERLFRPGYAAHLVTEWIPALEAVHDKLQKRGKVADLGCGHGASTILLALGYPDCTVTGFDFHQASIDVARKRAAEAGVADRVGFDVCSAQDFPGEDYDLICVFDALHDMGDPPGAARRIREALAPDGTWLLVEPMAGELLEDDVNALGRIFYAASTCICTPSAQAQEGGYALGSQVQESTLAEIVTGAGFSRFRRVSDTPFNRIYEARP